MEDDMMQPKDNLPWADDEIPRMTPDQFDFLRPDLPDYFSDHSIEAARQVMVEGRQQNEVAEEFGIHPPQLSTTLSKIRRAFEKSLLKYGLKRSEFFVPIDQEPVLRVYETAMMNAKSAAERPRVRRKKPVSQE